MDDVVSVLSSASTTQHRLRELAVQAWRGIAQTLGLFRRLSLLLPEHLLMLGIFFGNRPIGDNSLPSSSSQAPSLQQPFHLDNSAPSSNRPIREDSLPSSSSQPTLQQQSLDFENSTSYSPKSQYDATGFLGSTSFSAIYTEHAVPSDIGPQDDRYNTPPTAYQELCDPIAMAPLRIQRGAGLLAHLNDLLLIERLADRWYQTRQGLGTPIPLVSAIIQALKVSHETLLSNAREHDLAELSSKICHNSQQPLKVRASATASNYVESFMGQNLRWEPLGILFSIAGASAMTLSDGDKSVTGRDDRVIDRKGFVSQMMSNSDGVLSFCSRYRRPNDLMPWLMYENFILVTLHHGDSSKLCPEIQS